MINDTTLTATIMVTTVIEKEILPLEIRLQIGLAFDDADPHHQAIAIARTRFLLNEILDKAIFCSRHNPMIQDLRKITNSKILECWDDPWDQFIAMMIYYKTTAILEGAGSVEFIQISGDQLSPDLQYKYHAALFTSGIIDEDALYSTDNKLTSDASYCADNKMTSLWYHRPDTSINEDDDEDMSWEMLGLTWEPLDDDDVEEKSPKKYVNNIRPFVPKIIK